jgi:hypothetical protein
MICATLPLPPLLFKALSTSLVKHHTMSHLSKSAVFIVAAKRTAFGAFGGKLKDFSCTDLAVEAAKAALADGKVDPAIVDSVFVGNVSQTNADTPYM